MAIIDQVNQDLKEAMRAQNRLKMDTLRSLKTLLKLEANQEALSELEELDRLNKAAKQRRESYETFKNAGRIDLADKELTELKIIENYLPKQLSESELIEIIQKAKQKTGANSAKDIGLIMKELMPQIKGKADGKLVQELVKAQLS